MALLEVTDLTTRFRTDDGIVKAGLLGEVYHARLVWHRNGNWRRQVELPAPGYSPAAWGYPTMDHLINWRLYNKYSRGHMAELASHMVAITDWFFGAEAEAVVGSGGVFRYKDGREVPDHTYVTIEYPGGRTAVFTSIESNAFDHYYEAYYGTRGTLILRGEIEAYLFDEGQAPGQAKPTAFEVTPKSAGPAAAASESRAADAAGRGVGGGAAGVEVAVGAFQVTQPPANDLCANAAQLPSGSFNLMARMARPSREVTTR